METGDKEKNNSKQDVAKKHNIIKEIRKRNARKSKNPLSESMEGVTFPKPSQKSSSTIIRLFMLTALLVASVALFGALLPVVSVFAFGAIAAYLLNPVVGFFRKKLKFPKWLAVTTVVLILLGLFSLIVSSVIPPVYNQISSLVENLPHYRDVAVNMISELSSEAKSGSILSMVLDLANGAIGSNSIDFTSILTSLGLAIVNLPSKIFQILLALLVMVYFLVSGRAIVEIFVRQFTPKSQTTIRRILSKCDKVAWRYLKARLVTSSIMATTTFIGFSFFKLDYALLLALLAFVLDFIPYFGSITGGIVAGTVMLLTQGLRQALYLGAFILCVQQIECNILAPRIEGDSVGISPVIILFSIFACNHLFGFLGMLLATPLICIVRILLQEFRAYYISLE